MPFDAALVVGMNLLRLYLHRGSERDVPEHLRLVHLDCNPNEIGKNFPVEVALFGDPKAGLAELAELLTARLSRQRRGEAAARVREWADRRAAEQAAIRAEANQLRGERPMHPRAMMAALAGVLPADVAVVEEAPTSHHQMFERLGVLKDAAGYFAHRGW